MLVLLGFVIAAGIAAYAVPGGPGSELAAAAVKLVGAALYVLALRRLGWMSAKGDVPGRGWRPWLLALPAIVYSLIVSQLVFFGSLRFEMPDPAHAAAVALNMIVDGGFQELAFRGLLLLALARAWGSSRRGVVASVLVSAALFGGMHVLNLLARDKPLSLTLLQIAETTLSGITYAALVLAGGSIWPVVAWHGLLNALVSARAIGIPDFRETTSMWALVILANLPLLVYGVILLARQRPRPASPDTA